MKNNTNTNNMNSMNAKNILYTLFSAESEIRLRAEAVERVYENCRRHLVRMSDTEVSAFWAEWFNLSDRGLHSVLVDCGEQIDNCTDEGERKSRIFASWITIARIIGGATGCVNTAPLAADLLAMFTEYDVLNLINGV